MNAGVFVVVFNYIVAPRCQLVSLKLDNIKLCQTRTRFLALLRTLRANLTPALLSPPLCHSFHFTCEGGLEKGGGGVGGEKRRRWTLVQSPGLVASLYTAAAVSKRMDARRYCFIRDRLFGSLQAFVCFFFFFLLANEAADSGVEEGY